ncbi:phosphatase 2C-like domain-containing protein, partial [Haematococcus lacustris]
MSSLHPRDPEMSRPRHRRKTRGFPQPGSRTSLKESTAHALSWPFQRFWRYVVPKVLPNHGEQLIKIPGMHLLVGSCVSQGDMQFQEDRVDLVSDGQVAAFAVYDGHCSEWVASQLAEKLLQRMVRAVSMELERLTWEVGSPYKVIKDAILRCYLDLNHEVVQQLKRKFDKARAVRQGKACGWAGSSAVTALVARIGRKHVLFVASCGDSSAAQRLAVLAAQRLPPPPPLLLLLLLLLLQLPPPSLLLLAQQRLGPGASQAWFLPLSVSHLVRDALPGELQRVAARGGQLDLAAGLLRTAGSQGHGLRTTRSFGSLPFRPAVTAEPDITLCELDPHQESVLYLASDGVAELLPEAWASSLLVAKLGQSGGSSAGQAAADLVAKARSYAHQAFGKGSVDNQTMLVVRFKPIKYCQARAPAISSAACRAAAATALALEQRVAEVVVPHFRAARGARERSQGAAAVRAGGLQAAAGPLELPALPLPLATGQGQQPVAAPTPMCWREKQTSSSALRWSALWRLFGGSAAANLQETALAAVAAERKREHRRHAAAPGSTAGSDGEKPRPSASSHAEVQMTRRPLPVRDSAHCAAAGPLRTWPDAILKARHEPQVWAAAGGQEEYDDVWSENDASSDEGRAGFGA